MASTVSAERGGPDGQTANGRTFALVDLRPGDPPGSGTATAQVAALALRSIEQAVRNEDRICPYATCRVAVGFGRDADVVSPRTLGERLARAIRRSAAEDGEQSDPSLWAARRPNGATPSRHPSAFRSATITVDRSIDGVGLHHRTVVRRRAGDFARFGTRHDDVVPGDRGTVLVVSPSRTSGGTPGLSAIAASAMAERLGFDVATVALSCDDEPVVEVRGAPVDLVVLVVEAEREPSSDRASWTSSTWHIPAQLAAAFGASGIDVLAVGAGAGAGALACCAAQGARISTDLDQMQLELSHDETATTDAPAPWADAPMPPRMESLVLLTASERRVLFYLTTGRSAQEIADDLVISVTTVRSHIRSILRKLGVRSQLAAVAIANGQDVGPEPVTAVPEEPARELAAPGVG